MPVEVQVAVGVVGEQAVPAAQNGEPPEQAPAWQAEPATQVPKVVQAVPLATEV
jgi:hypothetical protein